MTETKIKPITVIIVEDFKLTRVGLRCALNANTDIDVVAEAEDAVEGLKLIERYKPDVVLMDLGLPGMNGIEAMVKCKEMNFNSKIIALTKLKPHCCCFGVSVLHKQCALNLVWQ